MLHLGTYVFHPWMKAFVFNSILVMSVAACFLVPGIAPLLFMLQAACLELPMIVLFFAICTIQQIIIPTPPISSLYWTILSGVFGVLGFIGALFTTQLSALPFFSQLETLSPLWAYLSVYGLSGVVFGASVGLGQWLAIAKRSSASKWWVAINAAGYMFGSLIVFFGLGYRA
jgi:hypothetical protein